MSGKVKQISLLENTLHKEPVVDIV
jgi:hypothetical protein